MPWIVVDRDGKQERVPVVRTPKGVWVGWPGGSTFISKELSFASANQSPEDDVVAPMTGKVVKVNVKVGEGVEKDDVLVLLEAMKMEYRLSAPRAGVIESVNCVAGDLVDLGKLLVALEVQ